MEPQVPQVAPFVLIILGIATAIDLKDHRIPNTLTLPAIILGLILHSSAYGMTGVVFSGIGAVIGLCALIPFYISGGMGAGDVKLMAAAGSFLGPSLTVGAVCLTLVIGSILAIAVLTKRIVASSMSGSQATLTNIRFPYALAIALGVAVVLWYAPFFEATFNFGSNA